MEPGPEQASNFAKRRAWDARMLSYAVRVRKAGRELVWLGAAAPQPPLPRRHRAA